eukprot:Awhi_evm1s2537
MSTLIFFVITLCLHAVLAELSTSSPYFYWLEGGNDLNLICNGELQISYKADGLPNLTMQKTSSDFELNVDNLSTFDESLCDEILLWPQVHLYSDTSSSKYYLVRDQ